MEDLKRTIRGGVAELCAQAEAVHLVPAETGNPVDYVAYQCEYPLHVVRYEKEVS